MILPCRIRMPPQGSIIMNIKKAIGKAQVVDERLNEIFRRSELSVKGLAAYFKLPVSKLEGYLSGECPMPNHIAVCFAQAFKLNMLHLFDSAKSLPIQLRKSAKLQQFIKAHWNRPEYFKKLNAFRKDVLYVQKVLLNAYFIKYRFGIAEIKQYCAGEGKTLNSKRVAQILEILVQKGELGYKKCRITLVNGKLGKRMIFVYFKK